MKKENKQATSQSDWALLKRLWPYLKPNRWLIYVALCLTPLTMFASLIQPFLLKKGLDQHIVPGKLEGLFVIAAIYLGAVLLHYVLEATYTLSLAYAGQRTILRLRERIYRHFLDMAPTFFDKRPAGALLTRATSDIEAIGETLTSGVVSIVLDILMASGILGMMFWMNWKLTILLLFILPPLLWVLALLRRQLRHYFVLIRESLAAVNGYLAERLQGVDIIQLFNYQDEAQERFEKLNRSFKDATIQSNIYDALMYALVDGVGSICIALMLWYATSSWWQGWVGVVSIGLLAAFIDYMQRLFRPLQEFSGKIAIIQRATTALEKIFHLLDDEIRIEDGTESLPSFEGHLQFKDVSFAYDTDDVLHGISFEVKPGEVVALVGATGCGKTTITRLITRMYDGYRGSIQLDGKELNSLSLAEIRHRIAAVRQDIHLFSESARFNITLGNAAISDEQIDEAAKLVHADRLVKDWKEGWEHQLRDRGSNLSVGEGQLLTFARTMAYDPDIVILDEATASIDPQTEGLIQDAIQRIFEKKTVLVVAHRLSTIISADRILVFDQGRLLEQGTHQELLKQDGRYKELYEKGFGTPPAEETD
ncbi:MAG: ABC transporter ATP-binding protein [Myxococcales bacterium]|nr:ABC transporter ATP-binding protein [Myxococcales bacterium]